MAALLPKLVGAVDLVRRFLVGQLCKQGRLAACEKEVNDLAGGERLEVARLVGLQNKERLLEAVQSVAWPMNPSP